MERGEGGRLSAPLAALAATIVPTAIGYWAVRGPFLARAAIGSLVAIAAMTLAASAGALVGHGLIIPGAVIGLLATAGMGRFSGRRPQVDPLTGPVQKGAAALVIAVGVVLLGASLFRPVPEGDAWAIWTIKALSILHTGDLSGPVFTTSSYSFSHPDYPPLLPVWQALAFKVEGGSVPAWPTQFELAWLWTAGGVALMYLVPGRPALRPVLIATWCCTPALLVMALSGGADMVSAMFLLCGTAALIRAEPWTAGGALMLTAAALTKNEGTVEAVAVAICLAVAALARSRRPGSMVLVPAAVVAAAGSWALVVRSRHLANDALTLTSVSSLRPGAVPGRVAQTWHFMLVQALDPALWGLLCGLILYAVVRRRVHWALIAAVVITFAVMTLRYVASPYQLAWDLRYSVERIIAAPLGLLVLAGTWALGADGPGPGLDPSNEARGLPVLK